MTEISTSDARRDFSNVVDAAYVKNERIVLMRNGKAVAAIVPIDDFDALERRENEADRRAVKRARRAQGSAKPRLWKEVKAELGLE